MKMCREHVVLGVVVAALLGCNSTDGIYEDGEIEILTEEQAAVEAEQSIDESNAEDEFESLKAEIEADLGE